MEENGSLFRKTMKITLVLLGTSVLWVGAVTLGSVFVVSWMLPADAKEITKPTTPAPKPASSDSPSRPKAPQEEPSTRRRNGLSLIDFEDR